MIVALDAVLERLKQHGLKLNRDKCIFAATSVEFLGHKIDARGVHKSDKHIEAIRDAPKPSTSDELQLFIGKATYYNSFIPDLATIARPLRDMLLREPFKWTPSADEAYLKLKRILTSPQVLIPYDPSLPLLLATDASKTGLGAVLSHRLSNGEERPIAYASRTMSATEQRYPQIDKETLAIVWAVQKFFYYVYARRFILITDHKPLTQILSPDKSLPVLCISRMANYADYLANFDYEVVFTPTKANVNADYCSRLPLPSTDAINKISADEGEEISDWDEFDQFIVAQIKQLPVRAEHISQETRKDTHLGKIVQLLEKGQSLTRFGYKAPEANYSLSVNCLIFEHRVVIPPSLQQSILNDLHAAHIGIVKMKGLARSFVYWPGIDADIELIVKSCTECAKNAHAPPKARNHHWQYPAGPWERIHIDYAGPVAGKMLLIIVDAYSKWIEVKTTASTTSNATIAILDELFAAYGTPVTVVSDNGRQFVSEEFKTFLKMKGVKYQKLTAPYHPSTNGQAERYVQTTKDALHKMNTTPSTLQQDLNEFLRQYRIAPHSTTGLPPAQLFLQRNLRTHLDLVKPDLTKTIKKESRYQCSHRIFKPLQRVYFISGNAHMDKWIPGTIITRLGDLHYEIDYQGTGFKRHVDQIRAFTTNIKQSGLTDTNQTQQESRETPEQPRKTRFYDNRREQQNIPHTPERIEQQIDQRQQQLIQPAPPALIAPQHEEPIIQQQQVNAPVPELRRSTRTRKPPLRFSAD